MTLTRHKTLLLAAPAIGVVAILVMAFVLPIGALAGNKMSEQLGPHGYVTISVVRGGAEIYHYEDHNLITNAGKNFIASQLGNATGASASYIALSNNTASPSVTDTILAGEFTSGGLQRAQGTYSHTADTDNWTISKTFTATASATGVQKAGLFTASSGGTMMAENTFSSVNLANGDTLTITWTIDLGLS